MKRKAVPAAIVPVTPAAIAIIDEQTVFVLPASGIAPADIIRGNRHNQQAGHTGQKFKANNALFLLYRNYNK